MTDRIPWRQWRPDQLVRSSFFLVASTVTMAVVGFLFWIVVARLYTPAEVGVATSLISAMSLISYFSLFGLNSTLVRFPAAAHLRNRQITQSIVLVVGAACVVASGYVFGLPWYGGKLLFLRQDNTLWLAFVAFCAFAALNRLTDAIFVAERLPQYNVLVDGVVQGVVKLALPVALLSFGSYGIVMAVGVGFIASAVASLFFMRRRLGFRVDIRMGRTPLLEQVWFSIASYVSSTLNLTPLIMIPLIVLAWQGAAAAGYFFIAFQIANLVNAVSYAVGDAVFAEVSNDESRFAELLRRSSVIVAAAQTPAAVLVAVGSGLILRVFGGAYAAHSQMLLVVLLCGSFAVALNTWASFALKLARSMKHLILSNVVYAVVTVGLAAAWASHGLIWIGWAWGIGNLASGVYAAAALKRHVTTQRATAAVHPVAELVSIEEGCK